MKRSLNVNLFIYNLIMFLEREDTKKRIFFCKIWKKNSSDHTRSFDRFLIRSCVRLLHPVKRFIFKFFDRF